MAGCMSLTACDGDKKSGNAIQMKDLEVVDGTTTDAMTDLDGVQSEVPAPVLPGASAGNALAPSPKEPPAANAAQSDTELLSDQ